MNIMENILKDQKLRKNFGERYQIDTSDMFYRVNKELQDIHTGHLQKMLNNNYMLIATWQ